MQIHLTVTGILWFPCPMLMGSVTLQGGPKLMAVKPAWQQHHHAYLAFSFPLEGLTSVLDIQGTHFQPVALPGLDPNCPTLLLAALPGGWMVQVTDQVSCAQAISAMLCSVVSQCSVVSTKCGYPAVPCSFSLCYGSGSL